MKRSLYQTLRWHGQHIGLFGVAAGFVTMPWWLNDHMELGCLAFLIPFALWAWGRFPE
jgi:hypothetical protein